MAMWFAFFTSFITYQFEMKKSKPLIPLGFEPRTSRVLGERDNHYTMESWPSSHLKTYIKLFRPYNQISARKK